MAWDSTENWFLRDRVLDDAAITCQLPSVGRTIRGAALSRGGQPYETGSTWSPSQPTM